MLEHASRPSVHRCNELHPDTDEAKATGTRAAMAQQTTIQLVQQRRSKAGLASDRPRWGGMRMRGGLSRSTLGVADDADGEGQTPMALTRDKRRGRKNNKQQR